jgi:ligand-binding sensor domain-containing protein/signal transduction histidine kinase
MHVATKPSRFWGAAGAWVVLLAFAVRLSAMEKLLVNDFLLRNWDFDDGMPSTHVHAIARTPDGFVWLGTAKGLVRFDGVHFVSFQPKPPATLEDSVITCLLVDREGALWAGAASGTLFKETGQGLVPVNLGRFAARRELESLAQDPQGAIWIATDGGGLVRLNQGDLDVFTTHEGLPSDQISAVLADPQGRLWAVAGGKLLTFEQGHWCLPDGVPATLQPVLSIAPSRDQGLWVATLPEFSSGGQCLPVFKLKQGQWSPELPAFPWKEDVSRSHVTALIEDQAGWLWCGTVGCGVVFRKPASGWQALTTNAAIPQLDVLCLAEDEGGTIWIGTRTTGLHQARPRLVTTRHLPAGMKQSSFLTVCVRKDGSIWGGTDGAGVFCWHEASLAQYGPEEGLTNPVVNALLEDRQGTLWAATAGGVFRFDGERFQSLGDPPALRAATFSLLQDCDGNLWAGTRLGLVRRRDGRMTVYGPKEGVPSAVVSALAQDQGGRIWAGLRGVGLLRQEGERFEHSVPARRANGEPVDGWYESRFLRGMLCDADGSVWLGTQGFGLQRLRDGVVDEWKWPDDGLPSNHHFGLMQDDGGNLWISSENGIFGYSKKALDQYHRGQNPHLAPWRLTTAEGLTGKVCSGIGQPSATRAPEGGFWFPNGSALAEFDPAAVCRDLRAWPAAVEEVTVDGFALALTNDTPLRVKSGARAFEFHYTSPNILSPERLCFRYQLEGLDKDWVEPGNRRVAYYNRLAPGKYVFRVMANGPQEEWSGKTTALELVVVPRLYERRSTQVAGALGFVLLVAGSVWRAERARSRRRLERLNLQYAMDRERQRIARDIHDDLGAGLTQIILLSDSLHEDVKQSPACESMVAEIASRARGLTRAMDEVVWAINPRNDILESFLTYVNRFAQEYLTRAGLRCRWDVPLEVPALPLSAETRHSLYLACKETLNNTIKHASASEVWVHLRLAPDGFSLTLEDNGKGFDTSVAPKRGNGLANMRQRLQELHGRCEVISAPGKGTRVEFTIRVAQPATSAGCPSAK